MGQFELAANPFQGFETEYKQIKFFTESGYFVKPEAVPFSDFSFTQQTDGETGTMKQVKVCDAFQYVPLKPMLKLILENPGTMEKILEWRNRDRAGLEDLRDGSLFKASRLLFRRVLDSNYCL